MGIDLRLLGLELQDMETRICNGDGGLTCQEIDDFEAAFGEDVADEAVLQVHETNEPTLVENRCTQDRLRLLEQDVGVLNEQSFASRIGEDDWLLRPSRIVNH